MTMMGVSEEPRCGAQPRLTTLPHQDGIDGSQIATSFEFFPPKTPAMERQVWETIGRLALRERSVGLGFMGFHSFLQAKAISFESAPTASISIICGGRSVFETQEAGRHRAA